MPKLAATRQVEIAWGTYLGGTDWEGGLDMALIAGDIPVVVGFTQSSDYPTAPGAYQTTFSGYEDAVITALEPDNGLPLWSTYLGGADLDEAWSACRTNGGNVLVGGRTWSPDFPTTTGAYDTTFTGVEASFVGELEAGTGRLLWLTLVDNTFTRSAVATPGGEVIIGGQAGGGAPVTAGAYDETFNGGIWAGDGFVARLSGSGQHLDWCTYLGGGGEDYLRKVRLGNQGDVVVVGYTLEPPPGEAPFPVTDGTFGGQFGGGADGFVSKLSPAGDALIWSSYLGAEEGDWLNDVAVTSAGAVVVTGYTNSRDYPVTSDAYQDSLQGWFDAMLSIVSADGEAIIYSTYLAGEEDDVGYCLELTDDGRILVSGGTASPTFPGPRAPDELTTPPGWDWFVAEFNAESYALERSFVIGGSQHEWRSWVASGADHGLYLFGDTDSPDLPVTPGAFQPTSGGSQDVAVFKVFDTTTPVMISGMQACRVERGARVEWALSGTGIPGTLRLWRQTTASDRRLLASWAMAGEGRWAYDDPSAPACGLSYWLQVVAGAGAETWYGPATLDAVGPPAPMVLGPCAPNPCNPGTSISFALVRGGQARLVVYDARGGVVRTLLDGMVPAGRQQAEWDGLDDAGRAVASGTYVVQLTSRSGTCSQKVTVAR